MSLLLTRSPNTVMVPSRSSSCAPDAPCWLMTVMTLSRRPSWLTSRYSIDFTSAVWPAISILSPWLRWKSVIVSFPKASTPVVVHGAVLAGDARPVDRSVGADVLRDDILLGIEQGLEAEGVRAAAAGEH